MSRNLNFPLWNSGRKFSRFRNKFNLINFPFLYIQNKLHYSNFNSETVTKQIVELHSSSPHLFPCGLEFLLFSFSFCTTTSTQLIAPAPKIVSLIRSFSLCGLISSFNNKQMEGDFCCFLSSPPLTSLFLPLTYTETQEKTSWFHYRFFTALNSFPFLSPFFCFFFLCLQQFPRFFTIREFWCFSFLHSRGIKIFLLLLFRGKYRE